eukprot:SAG31_NODE_33025_length_348_cov_14.618474_1_plen_37_part_10
MKRTNCQPPKKLPAAVDVEEDDGVGLIDWSQRQGSEW